MDLNLTGRTALITGAASGIGRATAAVLAAEGARIVLVDRDKQGLNEAVGEPSRRRGRPAARPSVTADLSTAEGVAAAMREALDATGGAIDIFVSNAGQCEWRTWTSSPTRDWYATLELNFMATVRAVRFLLPGMLERRRGSIVITASDLARQPERSPADYQCPRPAWCRADEGAGHRGGARRPGQRGRARARSGRRCGRGPAGSPTTSPGCTSGRPAEAVDYELSAAASPARPDRPARGGRQRDRLPGLRRRLLRHQLGLRASTAAASAACSDNSKKRSRLITARSAPPDNSKKSRTETGPMTTASTRSRRLPSSSGPAAATIHMGSLPVVFKALSAAGGRRVRDARAAAPAGRAGGPAHPHPPGPGPLRAERRRSASWSAIRSSRRRRAASSGGPAGVRHALWNAGTEESRFLEVSSPGREIEEFFRRFGDLTDAGAATADGDRGAGRTVRDQLRPGP